MIFNYLKQPVMKNTNLIICLFVFVFVFSFILEAYSQESTKEKKVVKILTSLDCQACIDKINKNIAFEKGVRKIEADLETKIVTITYRADKTTPEELAKAIRKLGYTTEIMPEKEKTEKSQVIP